MQSIDIELGDIEVIELNVIPKITKIEWSLFELKLKDGIKASTSKNFLCYVNDENDTVTLKLILKIEGTYNKLSDLNPQFEIGFKIKTTFLGEKSFSLFISEVGKSINYDTDNPGSSAVTLEIPLDIFAYNLFGTGIEITLQQIRISNIQYTDYFKFSQAIYVPDIPVNYEITPYKNFSPGDEITFKIIDGAIKQSFLENYLYQFKIYESDEGEVATAETSMPQVTLKKDKWEQKVDIGTNSDTVLPKFTYPHKNEKGDYELCCSLTIFNSKGNKNCKIIPKKDIGKLIKPSLEEFTFVQEDVIYTGATRPRPINYDIKIKFSGFSSKLKSAKIKCDFYIYLYDPLDKSVFTFIHKMENIECSTQEKNSIRFNGDSKALSKINVNVNNCFVLMRLNNISITSNYLPFYNIFKYNDSKFIQLSSWWDRKKWVAQTDKNDYISSFIASDNLQTIYKQILKINEKSPILRHYLIFPVIRYYLKIQDFITFFDKYQTKFIGYSYIPKSGDLIIFYLNQIQSQIGYSVTVNKEWDVYNNIYYADFYFNKIIKDNVIRFAEAAAYLVDFEMQIGPENVKMLMEYFKIIKEIKEKEEHIKTLSKPEEKKIENTKLVELKEEKRKLIEKIKKINFTITEKNFLEMIHYLYNLKCSEFK